ncbi:MAG TPA: homoserine O-succinyltransferase [Oleiagrimonas sp.]|nr:homoserine O-succinyltransferase [Oleiagrimonas sp.]
MSLEAVPLATTLSATPVTPVRMRTGFHCLRGRRRLHVTPRYGEGGRNIEVKYLWVGEPGAPTVIVQGGISASRDVCHITDHTDNGWWDELVGPGKAIDLTRVRVLAIDWLSADELGASAVSTTDQADILAALLDALHVGRVHGFVGASYGAMVGLAFAARHAHRLDRLVALAGAHRSHPLSTAQRSIQRNILRMGLANGCIDEAVSLARQLAMTTYRGSAEFAQRFDGQAEFSDGRFRLPVESWLEHVGKKFAGNFDAGRYLSLSESIDLHSVDPASVHAPTTLIGFATDRLVPLSDLCELQRGLGISASLEVVESLYGHDGFLKEHVRLAPLLREALSMPA